MQGAVSDLYGCGDSVFPETVTHARVVKHGLSRFHDCAVSSFSTAVLHWGDRSSKLSANSLVAEVSCEFVSGEFASQVKPCIPQQVSEGVRNVHVKRFEGSVCLVLCFEVVYEVRACIIVDDNHKIPVSLDRFCLHRSAEIDVYEFECQGSMVLGGWILASRLLAELASIAGREFARFCAREVLGEVSESRPSEVSHPLMDDVDRW